MPREQPINADVPAAEPSAAATAGSAPATPPPPEPAKQKRRRKPVPAALKAVGGLFLLAVVFIGAAIVGGGSGGEEEAPEAPRVVVEAPPAEPDEPADERSPEELGYPSFATANTTRVGGADAVANAAAVALAVNPSVEPDQRPDAVVLVEARDWRGALAAAVLAAPPLGAPLLISEADEVPEPTAQALAALDPQGSAATRGAEAFAIGAAEVPEGIEARRVGNGGSAGAAAILKLRDRLFDGPPEHIVVAPADEPALAMPAAAWAARSGDPVLFTEAQRLSKVTAAALRRHPDVPIYVLGPSVAIPSKVVREVAAISADVSRVSGEDAVSNAVAFARYADGDFGWNINDPGHGFVVARTDDPLAAAAAAPLSAAGTWGPLLLSDDAATLPAALRGYLLDVKPGYTTDPTRAFYNHVWVIGDQEAIEVSQQAEIDELAALAKIGGEEP